MCPAASCARRPRASSKPVPSSVTLGDDPAVERPELEPDGVDAPECLTTLRDQLPDRTEDHPVGVRGGAYRHTVGAQRRPRSPARRSPSAMSSTARTRPACSSTAGMQLADGPPQQPGGGGQGVVDPLDRLGVAVAHVLQVHPGGQDVLQRAVVQRLRELAALPLLDVGQLGEQAGPRSRAKRDDLHDAGPLDLRERDRPEGDPDEDEHPQPAATPTARCWRRGRRRWRRRRPRRSGRPGPRRPRAAAGWRRGSAAGRSR